MQLVLMFMILSEIPELSLWFINMYSYVLYPYVTRDIFGQT